MTNPSDFLEFGEDGGHFAIWFRANEAAAAGVYRRIPLGGIDRTVVVHIERDGDGFVTDAAETGSPTFATLDAAREACMAFATELVNSRKF